LDQVGTPEQGEVFYHDLLGMEAVTVDGRSVGEVVEVYELQAADLLEIRGPDKTHMIPYISSMVRSVDVEQNRVVLDPPDGLLDL
jgi:16S rRNA processing protein RimM